jgi:hypothetical protein
MAIVSRGVGPRAEDTGVERLVPHEASVSTRVKVAADYRKAEMRGMVGTVRQVWSSPNFPRTALLVQLGDGRYELLWHHEAEKVQAPIEA